MVRLIGCLLFVEREQMRRSATACSRPCTRTRPTLCLMIDHERMLHCADPGWRRLQAHIQLKPARPAECSQRVQDSTTRSSGKDHATLRRYGFACRPISQVGKIQTRVPQVDVAWQRQLVFTSYLPQHPPSPRRKQQRQATENRIPLAAPHPPFVCSREIRTQPAL